MVSEERKKEGGRDGRTKAEKEIIKSGGRGKIKVKVGRVRKGREG